MSGTLSSVTISLATLGAVGRSAQVEQRALPDGAIYTVRVM